MQLFWRVAKNGLDNPKQNGNYTKEELVQFRKNTNSLKNSFLNNTKIKFNSYSIPLTQYFVENNIINIKDYAYLERTIGMDLIIFDNHGGQVAIVVKLPFLFLVCEFISSDTDAWQGFKIDKDGIELYNPYNIPKYIQDFMEYDYKMASNIIGSLPEDKIEKIVNQAKQKAKATDGTLKTISKNQKINK